MESSGDLSLVGHRQPLSSRLKKLAAASILFAACASFAWGTLPGSLIAAGETRTLSLYHVHTKESLTITYKKNGRYIPSALEKLNLLLRDWRKNEVITIDPKTIDLMWELHADLGSQAPIHIISGYRSSATNAMLKKIGRNVAKQSMHIRGKAIDLYFPDISVEKIRGSAIVRQIGGVGYYPRSGSSGFVHIDSGRVRYWPRPNEIQLAEIMKDYKKTVGARMTNGYMATQIDTGTSPVAIKLAGTQVASVPPAVEEDESEASATPPEAASASKDTAVAAAGYPIPKPRQKPIEVLMLAAARMHIEPASAPPPRPNFAKRATAVVEASLPGLPAELFESELSATNPLNKANFAANALHDQTDLVTASAGDASSADDFFWWPTRWLFNTTSVVRRDSPPQPVDITLTSLKSEEPAEASQEPQEPKRVVHKASAMPWGLGDFIAVLQGLKNAAGGGASAKADRLTVNRSGKADIEPRSLLQSRPGGQVDALVDVSAQKNSIQ
jgi:uncharacterized protein YcbK (DUF882 family)